MEFKNTKQKKVSPRSILWSLYDREINGMKTRMNCVRATYQNVNPNCTIMDVKTPSCYLRKFTPDGRHLIAFSEDLTSIEVYDYLGCAMAANLLKSYQDNCIVQYRDGYVCWRIFEKLFKLRYRIKIPFKEQLDIQCSLFTDNGYALVVSATKMHDNRNLIINNLHSNYEVMHPNPSITLEDYTIYLVNLNCGAISHYIRFKSDKMYFSHNQGIYLLKNTIAILSIQYQVIHVYKIIQNRLCLLIKVGQYCNEVDDMMVASMHTNEYYSIYRRFRENNIIGLKQKLLIFLYKKAEREAHKTGSQYPLKQFYKNFNDVLSLRMWKMQLLRENVLLIRYLSEEVIALNIQDPDTQPGLFMIYNIVTIAVLDVFENTSNELLEIFERYTDNFRHPCGNPSGFMPSSISNNIHTWESYQKFKNTSINATIGVMETNRRILAQLPIAAQSFTSTPYLDKSLFSYDEMWVSAMEIPKSVGEHPLKFYSRDSGILRFCLHNREPNMPVIDNFGMVQFIFHPTDPFVISVQLKDDKYFINFHIRNVYMPE